MGGFPIGNIHFFLLSLCYSQIHLPHSNNNLPQFH